MRLFAKRVLLALACGWLTGTVGAHDVGDPGLPVCLEGNFMIADAMNAPFGIAGPGRVLEMNLFTGERGITVNNPFDGNPGNPPVPVGVIAPGPWKPTGVLSGGLNGHAFITSAAQHALTEFHRDGTPIRTVKLPMDDDPRFGTVPRLLGSQMMPNGNIIQNVCDGNFFNAVNSDPIAAGEADPAGDGNSSNLYFPPVYSTPERARNSRLIILDQESLEPIAEITAPKDPRWGCMAGVIFSDEGMFVSMFHGAAVFVIDWKAHITDDTAGVGANDIEPGDFEPCDASHHRACKRSAAKVIRVIDMLGPDATMDDPMRRDSLRAITFDERGNLYAAFRARSRACLRGEYPGTPNGCHPGIFRQHIAVVPAGEDYPTRTLALDPGMNVIAGIRTNRMSGPGCDAINPVDPATGKRADLDACDVETLLVATSAFNPGCVNSGSVPPNPCFVQGGGVGEYRLDLGHADDPASCSGDPFGDNSGCALPIATFLGQERTDSIDGQPIVDPRMLMIIHEAFVQ